MSAVDRIAQRWLRQASVSRVALRYKQALRKRQLLQMMNQGKTFGVISAYTGTSKHENQKRHGQLMADLQRRGYRKTHTLKAKWEGESGTYHEKSILIPNIKPKDLFDLGVQYEQDATIYKSADGIIGMYYPNGKYAEVAVDPKANPEFQTAADKGLFSKDRNWSFEFGFAWGEHLPWNGSSPISRKDVRTWLANKEAEAAV